MQIGGIEQLAIAKAKGVQNSEQPTTFKDDHALKEACDNFESFFIQKMLDISLKETKIAGEGAGAEIIKGMYTEALAKQSQGNLGLSNMLYEFLSKNNQDLDIKNDS